MEPFLGEIRLFAFGRAPRGWAACNGQLLPINQNQALFALLGVTYGGNGQTTFQLPDLRGRVPLGFGNNYPLGSAGGAETHALTAAEMAGHTHAVMASSVAGTSAAIGGHYFAGAMNYSPIATGTMAGAAVATAGASEPHPNMQPYSTVNFYIALSGIFPSRN
jgi:microcystin-dependent protein